MPRQETGRYKLSYGWLRGEDYWGDPVSLNFVLNDMLHHPCVKSMTQTTPPSAPAIGDMYVVPVGGIGVFKDQDNHLAIWTKNDKGSQWVFCLPTRGVRLRCDNPDGWYWWDGVAWRTEDYVPAGGPAPLGSRYDINISVGFEALPNDRLCAVYLPQSMVLRKDAPDSGGRSESWPPGTIIMTICRNGAPVGTVTFVGTSQTATVQVADDVLFAKGDLVTVVMPETVMAGFMNYGVTLRFILTQ